MAPGKFRPEIWLITGMRTLSLGVGVPIVRTHTLEQEVKAQFSLPALYLSTAVPELYRHLCPLVRGVSVFAALVPS